MLEALRGPLTYYNTHLLGFKNPVGQTFVFICLLDGFMLAAVLAFRLKMVLKVDSAAIAQSVQVSGQCIQHSALHLDGWKHTASPSIMP